MRNAFNEYKLMLLCTLNLKHSQMTNLWLRLDPKYSWSRFCMCIPNAPPVTYLAFFQVWKAANFQLNTTPVRPPICMGIKYIHVALITDEGRLWRYIRQFSPYSSKQYYHCPIIITCIDKFPIFFQCVSLETIRNELTTMCEYFFLLFPTFSFSVEHIWYVNVPFQWF